VDDVIIKIDEFMWNLYNKINEKEKLNDVQDTFLRYFRSWNRGDCSKVGLIKVFLLYIAMLENSDPMWYNDYGELIEFLKK